MALIPLTTYLTFPGALIPWPIIIDKHWDITDIMYSSEANLYCYAQLSVFSQIVINYDANIFYFFKFNQTFDVRGNSGNILFAIIRQKIMKHCMTWTLFLECIYFCLWLCMKMFHCNNLYRHRSISAVVFSLYLVVKTSNYTLSIITAT